MQCAFDLDDVDANSTAIEVVSASLIAEHTLIESEGIRGTRSRTKERVRRGLINVGGTVVLHPSPTELDALLPVILGATESTDTFALAESLPEFDFMIDTGAKVYDFSDLKVNSATFRCSSGQPLELEIDMIGKTVTEGNAGTFPALTFDLDTMFVFSDSVFTYDTSSTGDDYEILDFEVMIDNLLEARFGNSTTATSIDPTDRRVSLSVTTPWTATDGSSADSTGLYVTSSIAGSDGSLALTNGNQSLSFAFANLKLAPAATPIVNGRGEITKGITYNVYKSATTNELIVTHDSTA